MADFLVSYTLLLNINAQIKVAIDLLTRYLARIDRVPADHRIVSIRHHYVLALMMNTRYREAAAVQRETSSIATRLGDNTSKAYSLSGEIFVSTIFEPKPLSEFESLKSEVLRAAGETADAYIQNWSRFVVAWEEFHRGRVNHARDVARELMEVGQAINDPRSTGLGLSVLTWIALSSDSYAEALEYSEQSLATTVTPFDQYTATNGKGGALVLLRRTEEGAEILEAIRSRWIADGGLYYTVGSDGMLGICAVLQGRIGSGIHLLQDAISQQDKQGYRRAADWFRLFLSEVYLQVIAGNDKVPFPVLFKNLPVLLKIMLRAPSLITALVTSVLENPRFDPAGHHVGRAHMVLGLLYKARKRRVLAAQHLAESKQILSQFGHTPVLARVEAALAEMGN
jgi:hypothetical protein